MASLPQQAAKGIRGVRWHGKPATPGIVVLRSATLALAGAVALTVAPCPVAGQTPPNRTPAARLVGANDFLNSLTEAERGWLREHPVIRVAQDPSWPPIEFADAHGAPSGMAADYLNLIEARLRLKFERVQGLSWQEAYARMQRREIDMTTTVAVTEERKTFWAFTKPYMTMPIVIVTRSDVTYLADPSELEGRKVAVVDGYVSNIWLARDFPAIELVRVKTTEEALGMLQRGEVFACVDNMLVVGHYLAELKITDLKIAGTTPYSNAQCMAVRKDWAPLAGILDKALDSVSQAERDAIYRKWLPVRYEYGSDSTRLLAVAVIVPVFLLGFAAWRWKREDESRGVLPGVRPLKPWQAYLFAISATGATFGLRLAMDGPLGGRPTLVVFTLPIMLSAYLGGLRAGLLATAVSYFGASYYLLPPVHSFAVASGPERWQQFSVALAGLFISGLSEVLHRARERADIAGREHRDAEERLAEALAETHDLRAALDEHAIVAITDPQGKITFANDKFCTISKYSREELIGQDHRIINSGFHPKEFMRELWTTIARGKVWQGEIRNRAKDGSFYWLATTIVPFLNVEGKPRHYVAIRADITERKLAEAERARLLHVLESSLNEIYIFDPQTLRFQYANDGARRNLGYSMEALNSLTPVDLKPEFNTASFTEIVGPLRRHEKEKLIFQTVHRRADGSLYPVEVHLQLVEREGDAVFLAVINDITERKQAEQSIRVSEEYFRFLNDLANSIRHLSEPGRIMAVMAKMLGTQLRASRCAYADVADDGEQFNILHDYTDGCASTVGRYQLSLFGEKAVTSLHQGQTLVIRNVAEALLPEDGANMFDSIGIQAIICCPLVKDGGLRAMMAVHQSTPRDWQPKEITLVQDVAERCWAMIERRTAEEEILELNTRLEQRVMDRTAELESANKELESFSYSVSHDLRAPLRAVNGFAKIVLDTYAPQLPAEAREYLQDIRAGGEQMGQLIDDLLAFSRLGRQAMKLQPVATAELLEHVLGDLAPQHEGRPVEIKIEELPECEGDPALLKQVWLNLVSNALKYTRGRTPAVIEIGSQQIGAENVFFIRDNGVGFDMRYVQKLFGVFQRLHRADEFEGTGVGLAIVHRIIHRHGGRVWAEAEAGRGAIFQFTLKKEK